MSESVSVLLYLTDTLARVAEMVACPPAVCALPFIVERCRGEVVGYPGSFLDSWHLGGDR